LFSLSIALYSLSIHTVLQQLSPHSIMPPRNATAGAADDRPSSSRRKSLREADLTTGKAPTVSNFFPLERYYDASDKVSNMADAFIIVFGFKWLIFTIVVN
jgi:hypothetical protein